MGYSAPAPAPDEGEPKGGDRRRHQTQRFLRRVAPTDPRHEGEGSLGRIPPATKAIPRRGSEVALLGPSDRPKSRKGGGTDASNDLGFRPRSPVTAFLLGIVHGEARGPDSSPTQGRSRTGQLRTVRSNGGRAQTAVVVSEAEIRADDERSARRVNQIGEAVAARDTVAGTQPIPRSGAVPDGQKGAAGFGFISSLLLIYASASFQVFAVYKFLHFQVDWVVVGTYGVLPLCIYTLDRIVDAGRDVFGTPARSLFYQRHSWIAVPVFAALLVSFMLLTAAGSLTLAHWVLLFAGVSYTVKTIPCIDSRGTLSFCRLRDLGGGLVKTVSICLCWTCGAPAVVILSRGVSPTGLTALLSVVVTSLCCEALCNLSADLLDEEPDRRAGLISIPAVKGARATYLLVVSLNVLAVPVVILLGRDAGAAAPLTAFHFANVGWAAVPMVLNLARPIPLPKATHELLADSYVLVFSTLLIAVSAGI